VWLQPIGGQNARPLTTSDAPFHALQVPAIISAQAQNIQLAVGFM
jgi:hypothetical protein